MCRAKRLTNSFGDFSFVNGKYLKTKVEDVLQNCFQSVLSLQMRLLKCTHFRCGLYKIQ